MILPQWLLHYKKSDLQGDLTAGLIVAIIFIPQGIAYAMIAGLPPVMGLYAATIPLLIYALLGSSRHLSIGPVAMYSLIIVSGVSALAAPGSEKYITYVLAISLLSGLIRVLMGLFKLGYFMIFISNGVISAFTLAGAVLIACGQLGNVLGVSISTQTFIIFLTDLVTELPKLNWMSLFIGLAAIFVLQLANYLKLKTIGLLVVIILSILASEVFHFQASGVKVLGDLPQGLPQLSLPILSLRELVILLPISLAMALIGFVESTGIAKLFGAKERYPIYPNRELFAQGFANIGSAFFSALPVTGVLSRTAAAYLGGGKTQLTYIVTAVLILLFLLFLSPLFYALPFPTLGAIVLVAIFGFFDFKKWRELHLVDRLDGYIWMITFLATLFFGVINGIAVGILFSLAVFIWRSVHPNFAELAYLPEEKIFRNVLHYPQAQKWDDILIFRFDAGLYFANMDYFASHLSHLLHQHKHVDAIILDFSGVTSMDAVAFQGFNELVSNYQANGVKILIADMKGPVKELFLRGLNRKELPEEMHYFTIEEALRALGKAI